MLNKIVIGSRGSALALWQAEFVRSEIETKCKVECEIKIIHTKGDLVLDKSLGAIGDKGLFTKELELALLNCEIDIAVHSLKDMQTEMPANLYLACVPRRGSIHDALVAAPNTTIKNLPQGATVATGSVRRKAQLLALRPDLNIVDIRGNVQTRLKKFYDNNYDAMILALAGLERLGLTGHISQIISTHEIMPAVAQGALGLQTRGSETRIETGLQGSDSFVNENNKAEIADRDRQIISLLSSIEDHNTRICVEAERAFLRAFGGGCHLPVAANAQIINNQIVLQGVVSNPDGTSYQRHKLTADTTDNFLGAEFAKLFSL